MRSFSLVVGSAFVLLCCVHGPFHVQGSFSPPTHPGQSKRAWKEKKFGVCLEFDREEVWSLLGSFSVFGLEESGGL